LVSFWDCTYFPHEIEEGLEQCRVGTWQKVRRIQRALYGNKGSVKVWCRY
jgi:hypothetical protein